MEFDSRGRSDYKRQRMEPTEIASEIRNGNLEVEVPAEVDYETFEYHLKEQAGIELVSLTEAPGKPCKIAAVRLDPTRLEDTSYVTGIRLDVIITASRLTV